MSEEKLFVNDFRASMQHFSVLDYILFVLMLAICGGIGLYFGFVKKQKSTQDYLMGGRNMKLTPVVFSLVASFISGISLLGTPTEFYVYGTSYVFFLIGAFLMAIIVSYTFLPVLHELQLTSAYEYLELRFDKRLRVFGSVIFSVYLMAWLPIVIYVPALAFNQVTGVNIHIVTPIVCVVCIFYTTLGGLKAVVWTDVFQTICMISAMILIIVQGTLMVGGFQQVMRKNWDTGRIEFPSIKFDMTERHSIWSVSIGSTFYWIGNIAVNQSMMQRFLSLRSLKQSKSSLSTGLNSMAAVVLEDFWKPFFKELSHRQTQFLVRAVVVVLGVISMALVFVVERLGSVLQLTMSLSSASMGPLAGIFIMGIFLPFIDATSALTGGISGLLSAWWVAAFSQLIQAKGDLRFDEKPRFTFNCSYTFEDRDIQVTALENKIPFIYRISYLWFTSFGCTISVIIACLLSLRRAKVCRDKKLFAPFVRKWIKANKPVVLELKANMEDNGYQ